jgi:hypothetical protein
MSLFIARGTDGAVDKWLVAELKNGTRRTGKKNLVSFLGSPIERNNGRTQELRCDTELQISGELLAQEIPSACRTRGSARVPCRERAFPCHLGRARSSLPT